MVGQPFWHRGQERSQAGGWEETGGGAQAVTNEKVSTDGEEEGWGPLVYRKECRDHLVGKNGEGIRLEAADYLRPL